MDLDLEEILGLRNRIKTLISLIKDLEVYNIENDVLLLKSLLKEQYTERINFIKASNHYFTIKDRYIAFDNSKDNKTYKMKLKRTFL